MMGFFWMDFSQDRRTFQVSDWVVTFSEPIEVDVELVPLNATIIPMKFHEIPMSCPLNADLEISDLEMHHNSFPQPSPHWCHRTHWDRHISGHFCLSASLLNHHFYRVVPTCYKYICWSQWGLSSHFTSQFTSLSTQFTSIYFRISRLYGATLNFFTSFYQPIFRGAVNRSYQGWAGTEGNEALL